ncbi:MAG: hypothetical protein V1875_08790 [Candidatus Altiarchaeota archaeon]
MAICPEYLNPFSSVEYSNKEIVIMRIGRNESVEDLAKHQG